MPCGLHPRVIALLAHDGEMLDTQQRGHHLARKQLGVQSVLRAMGDQRCDLAVERGADIDRNLTHTRGKL